MRILYPILFTMLTSMWLYSISNGSISKSCDQPTYDMIYRSILKQAIESELSIKDIDKKNDSIENLRKLCNGQKSTLEMKGSYEKP